MGLIRRYESKMHGDYKRAILRYGFFGGLIFCVVLLLRWLLVLPPSQPMSYVENVLQLVLLFVFVYLYKRRLPDRRINFKESYVVALGTAVVSAVIYGMFMYVYASYIDTQMQERCFEFQRMMNQGQYTEEQLKDLTKPSYIAFSAVLLNSVMAVLWAMIVAIFLRNERAIVVQKQKKKL